MWQAQLLAPGRLPDDRGARTGARLRPMSGFDNAKLDEEFFGAGKECEGCEQEFFPAGHVKSNFLCNLGTATPRTYSRERRGWNSMRRVRF